MRKLSGNSILSEAVDGCIQEAEMDEENVSCTGLQAAEYILAIAKENDSPRALVYIIPAFILRTFYANKTFKRAPYAEGERYGSYLYE